LVLKFPVIGGKFERGFNVGKNWLLGVDNGTPLRTGSGGNDTVGLFGPMDIGVIVPGDIGVKGDVKCELHLGLCISSLNSFEPTVINLPVLGLMICDIFNSNFIFYFKKITIYG
jgi:hypothetical protein